MLKRYWINQPSTLQEFHNLHGKNVLADPSEQEICRCYFTEGEVISMRIKKSALSPDWVEQYTVNPDLNGIL